MSEDRRRAADLIGEMLSPEIAAALEGAATSTEFGAYIGELAYRSVFTALWTRPGLDRRSRSLVTLGILIAQHAGDELNVHIRAALNNGLTIEELEEVIYHSTAYAGFPAATAARNSALKTLRAAGHVD